MSAIPAELLASSVSDESAFHRANNAREVLRLRQIEKQSRHKTKHQKASERLRALTEGTYWPRDYAQDAVIADYARQLAKAIHTLASSANSNDNVGNVVQGLLSSGTSFTQNPQVIIGSRLARFTSDPYHYVWTNTGDIYASEETEEDAETEERELPTYSQATLDAFIQERPGYDAAALVEFGAAIRNLTFVMSPIAREAQEKIEGVVAYLQAYESRALRRVN